MKKQLLILILLSVFTLVKAQNREPFAPVGTQWKYWFAGEYNTGYINVEVVEHIPKTGVIYGTTEEITVNCAAIYSARGVANNIDRFPIPSKEEWDSSKYKFLFKEGNKAYIYDQYSAEFFKLIDMDASPGDQWEMSLFNGTYSSVWEKAEFYHNSVDGVPEELVEYYRYNSILCITDLNWPCYLDDKYFGAALLDNGITQAQIDTWKASYTANCITTGPASEDTNHPLFQKVADAFSVVNDFVFTPENWACDFKYYVKNIDPNFRYQFSYSEQRDIKNLCDAYIDEMPSPEPLPVEIENIWDKVDAYNIDSGISSNYRFKLITRYNWPMYIDGNIKTELMKPVEEGGLGLTSEQIETRYTSKFENIYNQIPTASDVDYIQVAEKRDIVIADVTIPTITMIPACESLLDSEAFSSNVSIYGALNINYLNVYGEPWPKAIVGGSSEVIVWHGLLCSNNGEYSIETPQLQEYFKNGLKEKFENEQVSCDQLEAPIFVTAETQGSNIASDNVFGGDLKDGRKLKQQIQVEEPDSIMVVNAVVHVIHNINNPESRISEEEVNNMIESVNDAFTAKNDFQHLNPAFNDVVGNPGIELRLATVDSEGKMTTGIVYYETEVDEFTVGLGAAIEDKYAFKFNDVGQHLNWDHTKYLNIFIADMGGKRGVSIGGFVTTPDPKDELSQDDNIKWLESNDLTFWQNWLTDVGSDAPQLDGLSLDYYATFKSEEVSDDLKYKTAIHELGHYFGLRHTFATVMEFRTSLPYPPFVTFNEVMYGDNFEDTPSQYYKTTVYDDCSREIYQCGTLIQVNNFMDYSLPCACMFTKEQSAFMREFTSTLRPEVFTEEEVQIPTGIVPDDLGYEISIYPNPTVETFRVAMNSDKQFNVKVITLSGRVVKNIPNIYRQADISLEGEASGVYIVNIVMEGKTISKKLIKR